MNAEKIFSHRGREKRLVSFPLPPNRTGGSPASGSPVGGSPRQGLTGLNMGSYKSEQPLLSKERIRPAMMISPASTTTSSRPFAQDTAKSHAYPPIQARKGRFVAMFEILKPAHKRAIDVRDDYPQAMSVSALGLDSNRVFKLFQALLPWPFHAPFEVVSQKVKAATLRGAHDPGLDRVQRQSGSRRPLPYPFQGPFGFFSVPAQNDEVVRVSHHLDPLSRHLMVERIKVDVRQQRADDRPLRCSRFGCPRLRRLHHLLAQKRFQQLEHSSVRYFLLHSFQQLVLWNRVEVALQVRVYYPGVSGFQQLVYTPKRIFAAPTRSKSVALFGKVPLKDRLQHGQQRGFRHSISNRRNPKRAFLLAAWLVDPLPLHRCRPVTLVAQRSRKLFQVLLQVTLEHLYRLMVYACRPLVRLHLLEGCPQVCQDVHLIDQAKPLPSFDPLFEGRQHPLSPDRRFDPSPSGSNLSSLRSRFRHSRWFVFRRSVPHRSTSLRSLRSRPVTALHRSYERSDSWPPGSSTLPSMNTGSRYGQVSLIHALDIPIPPPPTTPRPPASLCHATPQLAGSPAIRGSRLRHSLAGSPVLAGRIEFVILRMDRSPPAALHPALRRRSCSRLQTGERMSEEDFHLSSQRTLRRTRDGPPGRLYNFAGFQEFSNLWAVRLRRVQHANVETAARQSLESLAEAKIN